MNIFNTKMMNIAHFRKDVNPWCSGSTFGVLPPEPPIKVKSRQERLKYLCLNNLSSSRKLLSADRSLYKKSHWLDLKLDFFNHVLVLPDELSAGLNNLCSIISLDETNTQCFKTKLKSVSHEWNKPDWVQQQLTSTLSLNKSPRRWNGFSFFCTKFWNLPT